MKLSRLSIVSLPYGKTNRLPKNSQKNILDPGFAWENQMNFFKLAGMPGQHSPNGQIPYSLKIAFKHFFCPEPPVKSAIAGGSLLLFQCRFLFQLFQESGLCSYQWYAEYIHEAPHGLFRGHQIFSIYFKFSKFLYSFFIYDHWGSPLILPRLL